MIFDLGAQEVILYSPKTKTRNRVGISWKNSDPVNYLTMAETKREMNGQGCNVRAPIGQMRRRKGGRVVNQ